MAASRSGVTGRIGGAVVCRVTGSAEETRFRPIVGAAGERHATEDERARATQARSRSQRHRMLTTLRRAPIDRQNRRRHEQHRRLPARPRRRQRSRKTMCSAGSRTLTGIALAVEETWPPTRWLNDALAIAPKTAMPRALPIDRANMLVPVTTPRRSHSTEDCAEISVGLGHKSHAQTRSRSRSRRPARPSCSRTAKPAAPEPIMTTAAPISAVLRKPIRR